MENRCRMAGPVYSNLVMSLLRKNDELVSMEAATYRTSLPVHTISFRLMGWLSMVCGSVLFMEQYFLRRVSCFNAENFKQPPTAIAEYCWEHGEFISNTSSLLEYISPPSPLKHMWLQQAYTYFFVRFFVFALPHMVWQLKYKAYIQSVIKGTADVIKELETVWLKHGQLAESAFHKRTGSKTDEETIDMRRDVRRSLSAVMAMTRDTVQITQHQVPHYAPLLSFIHLRMFLEVIFLSCFVVLDFILFLLCTKYDSTDFHCRLPNSEIIRCMTPMMQLLWQVALLSLLCSCFTLLLNSSYSIYLICSLLNTNTNHCFLQHIPYAATCHDLKFKSRSQTRVYKLLSKFLLQNYVIVQPLSFLESYVQHLDANNHVPMELLVEDDDGVKVKANNEAYTGVKNQHREHQVWESLLSTDI